MAEKMLYGSFPVEFSENARNLGPKNTSSSEEFLKSFLERRMPDKSKNVEEMVVKYCYLGLVKRKQVNKTKRLSESIRKGRGSLSVKEKKFLRTNHIGEEKNAKYETFVPLHQLWLKYFRRTVSSTISQLSENVNNASLHAKLLKCDFHGCIVSVTKSKCPSLVGTTGIVVQETRNVFKIVTAQDTVKVVPKVNNVFTFEVDGFAFTIYGNQFRVKPGERAVRKFKAKATIGL